MYYTKKAKGIKAAIFWFNIPEDLIPQKYGFCFYNNMMNPIVLKPEEHVLRKRDALTLLSNLTCSDDELLQSCESNVRNEIRRAKKDGAACQMFTAKELLGMDWLLKQFDEAFAEMHRQKGLQVTSTYAEMKNLADCNALFMSICRLTDETVAYHVYVSDGHTSRLMYSVSVFRNAENNVMRTMVGRANRLLHYEDMLWFKGKGAENYDWGGYSTDEKLFGINAFKKGFGGKLCPCYYLVATSHWWLVTLYRLWTKAKGNK